MARRCAFAAVRAASETTPAATAVVAEASTAAGLGKQSWVAESFPETADIEPSHLDRMTTARLCSPAAIRHRDKNSGHHQCRYDCIGDSASCWPRFVCSFARQSIRDAKRAQERGQRLEVRGS